MTTLIVELRTLLNQVCEGRQAASTAAIMNLKDSLHLNKKRIINLLDDLPKNAEHRKTLESGKALIHGKEFRVNEDFIKQALFLADQLNVDEFESARLLLDGISQATTVNSTALDTAVYLYHTERGYILAILNVILEAAKDPLIQDNVRYVFVNFMTDLMKEKTSVGSFVGRIVKSTKDLATMISSISKIGQLESAKIAGEQQLQKDQQELQQKLAQNHYHQLFEPTITQHKFDPETVKLRIDRLTDERISLVQILYHVASFYWLPEDDLLAILTKVQSMNLSDNTATYMLTALLAALSFECSYPRGRQGIDFSNNYAFLKKVHDQITKKEWKVNTLLAVVSIQWALFISVIAVTRTDIYQSLAFDKKAKTELVQNAISLDAFGFMNNYLLYFKQKADIGEDKKKTIKDISDDDSAMALDGLIVDPNDYNKFNVEINTDFQKFVVLELESLTQSYILHMSDIYMALKSKALEDQINQQPDSNSSEEIHNTLTKFITLLASIYRDRMNAGLKFWNRNNGLHLFLGFLVEFKVPQCFSAIFDFMGSISTGVQSAAHAHAMFKVGTDEKDISSSYLYSWGKLFSALHFYIKQYQENSAEDEPPALSTAEEDSLCKFLYLCQQTVQYSTEARSEIWSNSALNVHASIVHMISCPTSTRFRAALYDLLAAFCSNWGGGINGVGKKIALEVWGTLEYSDMIIPDKVMVVQPTEAAAATPASAFRKDNSLFSGIVTPQQSQPAPTPAAKPASQQYYLPEQPAGFLREFEEEKNTKFYTETLSVLNLMASLIHTQSKRDELISGFAVFESSVPHLLGHDNKRTPGTAPYVSLVIDHIFLNLKNQKYAYPDIRWQLTDACLAIIENSVMAFNIEPLCDYIHYTTASGASTSVTNYINALQGINAQSANSSTAILQQGLLAFVTQPGYDVLIRILSGGALIHELFKIVEKGKNAVAQSSRTDTEKSTHFRKCMTRCLRIFSKVFKIQNAFVNIVLPQLNISSVKQDMGNFKLGDYVFPSPPPSLRSLGSLMLYNTEVIVQIALMVNCDDYEDICSLSTSLLSALAAQPEDNTNHVKFPNHINVPMDGIGSQLAGILLSSADSASIIFSFSERLEIESAEVITYDDYEYDMNVIPFWLAKETLANIYRFVDFNDSSYHHSLSIRITILDMLLRNMRKEIKSPTITEFLLGYDVKELEAFGSQQRPIPTDVQHKSQLACLLSILDMLRTGTDNDGGYNEKEEEPLIRSHPVLAEKCYQLIFKLCARESTSTATLHYLRNNCDDFFIKQFSAIASRLETCVGVSQPYFEGVLESADKTQISTDYLTMISVLNQRAWLLKLVALELHRTAHTTENCSAVALLELLYGLSDNDTLPADAEDALIHQMEIMQLQLKTNYQQPLWNMLEIVNSLEFTWKDEHDKGLAAPAVYFKNFDEKKYMIEKDGYSLFDIRSIYKILRQYQTTDPACADLAEPERLAMETEMGKILERLMAENRYREISYGRLHCLRAWKQVVEVTISDCFDLFSFESREKIIYDLLSVLLPKLENDAGLHVAILKGLSEVTLSLLTRLREDKRRQAILQVAPGETRGSAVAESRLPDEKLRLVFNSIINCIRKKKCTIEIRSVIYSALVNLLQYISPDDSSKDDALPENIRSQVVDIIDGGSKEKLLDIICEDASEGLDMYKTTAYMALEALYILVGKTSSALMHTYLLKKNFLQHTIQMIKRSDSELTSIINKRDASLIPLYNHEAKISLFMQIALKKEGANLLLSNGIINNISNCQFINTRFDRNQRRDADNAYKVQRHRRLLIPILELVDALLMNSSEHEVEIGQFKAWVKRQDVLVYILKDENAEITLSSLYILQLATSLLYQLSCQPCYFAGLEKNSLDELDSLLISLIPKYCIPRDWASKVVPTNPEEDRWAEQSVPETVNDHEGSVLIAKAEKYIMDIRKNLLAYAQASTFRRDPVGKPSFKPIFANTLESIKEQTSNTANRASSMTPSLTTLVSVLSFTGKKLSKAIADYDLLCAQKDNVQSLKYEEVQEIANTAIPKRLGIKYDSLNPTQKLQVLTTEISYRRKLKLKEIRDLFFIIENAVFILWRHLEFYTRRSSISANTTFSPCERYADETVILRQQQLFQTSASVIEKLNRDSKSILEPVVSRLESIPSTIQALTSLPEMYKRLRKCYN